MKKDRKAQCLEDLRMQILMQDIAPGSDLDEVALCEHYGISRTPMREVFQRLNGDGYIRLEQNRGAKVSSMDLTMMRMFFQTAPLVYANTARLAAENRRGDQVEALRNVQAHFRAATQEQDTRVASLYNHEFHLLIGEMAQNPYLLTSLKRMLIDHTRMSRTFYRPANEDEEHRVRKACEQHDMMIEAIARQEATLAVELTLAHWDLSRDRLEQFVKPDPLPVDVIAMKDHKHAI